VHLGQAAAGRRPVATLAFTICVMGFLGGLVMTAIKRGAGVKDWAS